MNILILGQSNGVRLAGAGEAALSALLSESLGEPVSIINEAVNGSPLTAVDEDYWLDTRPGSLYADMLTAVGNASIDAAVWIQGETDALLDIPAAEYEAGLDTLFTRLRGDLGDVPIYLQPLILRPDVFGEIRSAQIHYATGDPLTHIVEPSQELGAVDLNHFTTASYSVMGDAFARAILADLVPAWAPALGSSGNDTLTGTLVYADAGADSITGTLSSDVLLGESGSDTLRGAAGNDLMSGGSGNDSVRAGPGNDAIQGDNGADILFGGSGQDIVEGLADDDHIIGGRDSDALYGGSGHDHLNGKDGDDRIRGGPGVDTLTGGLGADAFYVDDGDLVMDFTSGEDSIILAHWITDVEYVDGRLYADGVGIARLYGSPALETADLLFV